MGGWLTPGDSALDAEVDFMAVAEQRLILARVRDEWSWLRDRGTASVCLPASQDSSHVGNAGIGVVSLRGAPLSMPTFATAGFRNLYKLGRVVFDVNCLWGLTGSCIWLSCMAPRVLLPLQSSFS